MSYRSWLQDAKTVNDLGSHPQLDYDAPNYEVRERREQEKQSELWKRPVPVDPAYAQFFGTHMHDAYVLGHERDGAQLTVRLLCNYAIDFVSILADLLEVETVDGIWPVHLVCHDVKYVRWARSTREGYLRWAAPKWRDVSDLGRADTLLFDSFEEQDGRLQWIVEFHAPAGQTKELGSTLLLAVDCARVSAIDLRLPALIARFGPKIEPVWQAAMAKPTILNHGFRIWHHKDMFDAVDAELKARGFTAADFGLT